MNASAAGWPDTLTTLVRWSYPVSGIESPAAKDYIRRDWPVLLVRRNGTSKALLKPQLKLRSVPDQPSEQDLVNTSLVTLKDSLAAYFTSAGLGQKAVGQLNSHEPGYFDDWEKELTNSSYAAEGIFPTRDALYGLHDLGSTLPIVSVAGVAVVVGVNHRLLNISTWSNVGLTFLEFPSAGVISSHYLLDDLLEGSAIPFLGGVPYAAFLVCAIFVGPSAKLKCADLPEGVNCSPLDGTTDYGGNSLVFVAGGERIYLNPRTGTGQSWENTTPASWMVIEPLHCPGT